MAFTVLKLLGAAYLLYLAWGAWNAPAMTSDQTPPPPLSPMQAWLRGVVMNITNPESGAVLFGFFTRNLPIPPKAVS